MIARLILGSEASEDLGEQLDQLWTAQVVFVADAASIRTDAH